MDIFSNFIPKEHYLNCVVNNKKFILEPTKKINFSDKPISIFNDYTPTFEELNKNPYNVLIILEPNQLHGLHDWTINNKENFILFYYNTFNCKYYHILYFIYFVYKVSINQ